MLMNRVDITKAVTLNETMYQFGLSLIATSLNIDDNPPIFIFLFLPRRLNVFDTAMTLTSLEICFSSNRRDSLSVNQVSLIIRIKIINFILFSLSLHSHIAKIILEY